MSANRLLTAVLCALLIAGVSGVAAAQPTIDNNGNGSSIFKVPVKPDLSLKKMSLLDPERFTMKHQYSMSFSSYNSSGSMMGMYLNTMEYRFNAPLTMRLQVAYQTATAQLFGGSNMYSGNPMYDEGRVFVPSFDLVYQPTDNMTIGFFFRDYSSANPYAYGNPYGMYRPQTYFTPYGFQTGYVPYYGSPYMGW